MKKPAKVAEQLSVQRYHAHWRHIPLEHLKASAVALPYIGEDGQPTESLVLMHKRRVTAAALRGEEPVCVCEDCHAEFRKDDPEATNAKFCLANWNWLGRHEPLLRDTTLGHQLLLAIGRVVSTKVYLSSKGLDESVRQAQTSWRQKFLQSGIQGTAIVYGNGSTDDAMRSFPASPDVMQECFVAVFTGPEKPTEEELAGLQYPGRNTSDQS